LTAAFTYFLFIDAGPMVALGASYGGYMINWIAEYSWVSQRFRALVDHDGILNATGVAHATDEVW
jgi:dipeptidyl aminopeptidase/acylaminoacyl peptidase